MPCFQLEERLSKPQIDSNNARDAFATFVPLSVSSEAKTSIIFDFFDLMAAIAAHGKTNGMAGRKLSRLAGWWAFEHPEGNDGFEAGYRAWERYSSDELLVDNCLRLAQCSGRCESSLLCILTFSLP